MNDGCPYLTYLNGKSLIAVFILILSTSVLRAEPLTQDQLSGLIGAGFPMTEVKEMVAKRGYSGALDGYNLKALRAAGADADLIAFLITAGKVSVQSAESHKAQDRLFRFTENGKFGYSDQFGRVIVQPQWEDAENFKDGIARVRNGFQVSYIDTTGQTVIKLDSSGSLIFSEGLAVHEKDGKYGYIDKTGHFVIEPKWNVAKPFSEGLAVVENSDGKYGYINNEGNVAIEPQWDSLLLNMGGLAEFSEGHAVVIKGDKFGYIDKSGSVVIEPQWDLANSFTNGLAIICKDNRYGFIDRSGQVVIKPEWDMARPFREDLAIIAKDKKFGFLDKSGRVVIEPRWDEARSFSEGLAAVVDNNKLGYIDGTGRVVIEPQWNTSLLWVDKMEAFSEGLALVKNDDGKYGYIDKTGRVVIALEWDDAEPFTEGFATVTKNDNVGAIDKTGKVVAGFGRVPDFSAFVADNPLPKDRALAVWSKASKAMDGGDGLLLSELVLNRSQKLLGVEIPPEYMSSLVDYYQQRCNTDFASEAKLPLEKRIASGIQRGNFTQKDVNIAKVVFGIIDDHLGVPAGEGYKNEDDYQIALALRFHFSDEGLPDPATLATFCMREEARTKADYFGMPPGLEREQYIAEFTKSVDETFRKVYEQAVAKKMKEVAEK